MEHFGSYIYIVSAGLFILSLKWMNSPATARRGVFAGETGMLLAIVGTLLANHILNWEWILAAFFIGSAVGVQAAINIGAALGVLPLTGVPLPLVSFGGTSLVVVLAGVGIVANIASNRRSYIVASTERHSRARGGRRDGGAHHPGPRGR